MNFIECRIKEDDNDEDEPPAKRSAFDVMMAAPLIKELPPEIETLRKDNCNGDGDVNLALKSTEHAYNHQSHLHDVLGCRARRQTHAFAVVGEREATVPV